MKSEHIKLLDNKSFHSTKHNQQDIFEPILLKTVWPVLGSILFILLLISLLHISRFTPSVSSAITTVSLISNPSLKWGIAGLGRISIDFATALHIAGANLTSVAAGSLPNRKERADAFGSIFNVPHTNCYGSYEELANDPLVDIVYIGNTNQLHYKTAIMLIEANKHVLVEKPTSMTTEETVKMIYAARQKGVFFGTNYWTRFFPAVVHAREQMEAGCIGDVVSVRGDFGFQAEPDTNDRFLNPITGGGAMLDMGCYLVQFATLALDAVVAYKSTVTSKLAVYESDTLKLGIRSPDHIEADGEVGNDGVDLEMSFLLKWASDSDVQGASTVSRLQSKYSDVGRFRGLSGLFSTSLRRASPFTVEIMGTHGFINIDSPANCPSRSVVNVGSDAYADKSPSVFPTEDICNKNSIGSNVFESPLPARPAQFGRQQYAGTTGFVYIISAIERCFVSSYAANGTMGCLELPELTAEEQVLIMSITEDVRIKGGNYNISSAE